MAPPVLRSLSDDARKRFRERVERLNPTGNTGGMSGPSGAVKQAFSGVEKAAEGVSKTATGGGKSVSDRATEASNVVKKTTDKTVETAKQEFDAVASVTDSSSSDSAIPDEPTPTITNTSMTPDLPQPVENALNGLPGLRIAAAVGLVVLVVLGVSEVNDG